MQPNPREALQRSARRLIPLVMVAATVALSACAARATAERVDEGDGVSTTSTATAPRDGRVVLVTIDGVRWQEIFEGSDAPRSGGSQIPAERLMPRTHALIASQGVAIGADRKGCGVAHTAGGTNVSLPGYLEIFTGRPSRCLDNFCTPVTESVLDEAARADVGGVASIGSWSTLRGAVSGGGGGVLVSVGRTWPDGAVRSGRLGEVVANGLAADPYPGHDDYRPDSATAAIALEYLKTDKPALLHIGLGDTDEYGHANDYAGYLSALRRADDVIGDLGALLETMGDEGARTTVIITPDHGRNADFQHHGLLRPESGRTFVIAFGKRVPVAGVACPARDVTLIDIAPTIRVLMGLPPDRGDDSGRPIALITGGAR